MQTDTFDNLSAFCDELDTVVNLYVIGSITSDDFKNEIEMLGYQYEMVLAAYEKKSDECKLQPGSHSYASKKGIDALEGMMDSISDILDAAVSKDGSILSPTDMAYVYLAYQQQITHYIAEYLVSASLFAKPDQTTSSTAA